MQSPPYSMTWASVSLNVVRPVYCSGRLTARTRAAAGCAQRAPTQAAGQAGEGEDRARPDDRRHGHGAELAAAHTPMASVIGSPAMNWGTTEVPDE